MAPNLLRDRGPCRNTRPARGHLKARASVACNSSSPEDAAHTNGTAAAAAAQSRCGAAAAAAAPASGGGCLHALRPARLSFDEAAVAACRLECMEPERGLVHGATVRFSDSPALRLRRRALVMWDRGRPSRALVVKKPGDAAATAKLAEMAAWLEAQGVQTLVEPAVAEHEFPGFEKFTPGHTQVDFAVTLGGDGTVLYLASLFDGDAPLPPVICFAMGTLGFLTPFDAADFAPCLERVLDANATPLFCTLRTRKRCDVEAPDGQLACSHVVLNEAVVDRGSFPGAVYLEIFIDGAFVTAAEADGLIIATPSGSTAYSMSAESAQLSIRVPSYARCHARASFDGKHPRKLPRGSTIHFASSLCPLPLINMGTLDSDWYEGITQKLKWNQLLRAHGSRDVPSLGDRLERRAAARLEPGAAAAAAVAGVHDLLLYTEADYEVF